MSLASLRVALVGLVLGAAVLHGPSAALAITDAEDLGRFGPLGSGAGELRSPGAIATDPVTGHVLVSDFSNSRISEFTPWGDFIRAFGWDVAPGPVDEQQEVRVRAAAGQFRLGFGAESTADLPFDATGAEVEAALNGLPSVGAGGTVVEDNRSTVPGAAPSVYVVTFKGAGHDQEDVDQLVATDGTNPLSGGIPTTSLEVRTRANGTAGGIGLETCTADSGCQEGAAGPGVGQMNGPLGLGVVANGDIYVTDRINHRVQKFNTAGEFLLMFGGEVNKTTKGNVCTSTQLAAGDVCGRGRMRPAPAGEDPDLEEETKGEPEPTPGFFENASFGAYIGLGPDGTVYVGDVGRVELFNPDGSFKSEFAVATKTIERLAVDPFGNGIYLKVGPEVRKVDSGGVGVGGSYPLSIPLGESMAVDPAGNLYVAKLGVKKVNNEIPSYARVLQFDSNGDPLTPDSCCVPEPLPGQPEDSFIRFDIMGLGTNANGNLYVSHRSNVFPGEGFVKIFGPGPVGFEAPPQVPPTIASQYAVDVGFAEASLGAEINPHFFSDTTFYLEYGLEDCATGGCAKKPAPPGKPLGDKVTSAAVESPPVHLSGLTPGTTYHYRFVAESGGGGPVIGPDQTFRTFGAPQTPGPACANQAFRTGAAARLPDCRAYEMVSPLDKNHGDVLTVPSTFGYENGLEQSATSGDALTYSSYRSFGDPQAAPYTNQYLARRISGQEWSTESLSPAQGAAATFNFETPFKAFTADLSRSWLSLPADPPLDTRAVQDSPTIYRRESAGAYEALTTAEEPLAPASFESELQGVSADGSHAVFQAAGRLTPDAVSTPNLRQLYLSYAPGKLRLVSVLPNGTATTKQSSAGSPRVDIGLDRTTSLSNALSEDGTRVYWSDAATGGGEYRLYLRENADQAQSAVAAGKCTEPDLACTFPVSQVGVRAQFWTAAPDGTKALYSIHQYPSPIDGNLYRFDSQAPAPGRELIAGGTLGVLGASEDLSSVYFASTEALAGPAEAGKANLYLSQGGAVTFIATLSETDVETDPDIPSNVAPELIYHAARVTPDGRHLVFISDRSPTGYDNRDAVTGERLSEIYLYAADSAAIACLSCNPSGARPIGRIVQASGNGGFLAAAASVPPALNQLYAPRSLLEDGSRFFFNSYDALLPSDTNGRVDVYQWERAGSGSCTEADPAFSPANGGCIQLISSGESTSVSRFLDADPSGRDVFFTTKESLVSWDPGLIDAYDAREGGGLPAPPAPPAICEGEACQGPLNPPEDPTPASLGFQGAGNVEEPAPGKPRCPKGKTRRKGRCVSPKAHKQARKHAKRTKNDRRASR